MSKLDYIYRKLLLTKFFTKGWGKPENLKRLFDFRKVISNRETCKFLVPSDYPIHIDKDEVYSDCRIMEGHFVSPFTKHLPGIMPKEVEIANFQVILPKEWKHKKLRPVCLHLAGTGDHYFWRRRTLMARPLLKEGGIASILLENPYYGMRKPKQQLRSSLHNVSDLFVMGGALVLESLALFHWCERQGWGPLGITGISMGGHMASLAATNWSKPLSLVPCLSWSTASCVFTQGVMRDAIPWNVLESQYFEDNVYEEELRSMVHSPEENWRSAYTIGQQFVKDYHTHSKNYYFGNRGKHQIREGNYLMYSEDIENTDVGIPTNCPNSQTRDSGPGNRKFSSASGTSKPFSNDSPLTSTTDLVEPHVLQHTKSNSRLLGIPFRTKSERLKVTSRKMPKTLQQDAVEFMMGVMDECTHLGHFSIPIDTSLIIIIAAKQDAYVPRDDVLSLDQIWPGAEVRYIDRGHITAFLLNHDVFRKAIIDAFSRQIAKYHRKEMV